MALRSLFFAIPQRDSENKSPHLWQAVHAIDDERYKPAAGYAWLDLFTLRRGPAKRARFLARFGDSGCGSGVEVRYQAYEWEGSDMGNLFEFIKLTGAISREERRAKSQPADLNQPERFVPIGRLQTNGTLITLPFCFYSPVDTWDNPNLCAVNTYDISRDRIRFMGSRFNRPDLVAIARAIKYATRGDFPAVRAYCSSSAVAARLVRDGPPFASGTDGLTITRVSASREQVEIGEHPTFHFDVEKHGSRWLVVSFVIER